MRRSVLFPTCAVLVGVTEFAVAPRRTGQLEAARSILEGALERLGGAEHVRSHRKWFVAGVGEENLSAELQGMTPQRPTVRRHQEWLGVDAEVAAVAWERRTPRNDQSLRWRRFIYRPDSAGFIVWTDSLSVINSRGTAAARRRAMMRRIPQLLLLEASRADSLQLGETSSLAGRRHREVRVRLDDAWISLWISSDSSLLTRAEYRSQLPGKGGVVVRWEWRDWKRDAASVLRPAGHDIVIDDQTYQRVEYSRFEIGSHAADSLLAIPNEVRSRPPSTPQRMSAASGLPATGEVAPGVHIEEVGGFNTLIVEFADFVLLVEAPSAAPGFEAIPATRSPDRIAAELAARVRAIAQGRPLGYTVITHAHSDHVGNAAALASLTRNMLVPADARNLVGAAHVEMVRGERTIRDSTRTVVIYDVGANPHSEHNLFIWLPREQIGFQGDLFYYDARAADIPPDRIPISAFFARWLQKGGIAPRAVYGVHNRGAADAAALDAAARR